ncbi:MerR family transcriptional regulator [Lentilactobacillus fungorum]|uniref:MerR family transcriptional regulator n=1 Tax=Lentilactobacillus fungorum TaxID=2201250 RepID=A0ABQ3W059_9LACO|nr:MerR family transcriptional regulator [Lentilactobacillus fungorum]GHP13059.1 MerR family transcriptional regulator [Lentilactobacillus fungorum]
MAELNSDEPFIDTNKLIFGIGQVQQITGVSGRQLRYWESQNYISPIDQKKGVSRQYSLHTLFLIFHINRFIQQGFTLQAAVDHAKEFDAQIPALRQFLKKQLKGVEISDDQTVIDFGYFNAQRTKRVYGVIDRNGQTFFEIRDVK